MQKALKAVAERRSINKAAQTFNVPRTTFLYKQTAKTQIPRKMGPPPILKR